MLSVNKLTFVALSLFFLGTTFVWLQLDHSPATWDDAIYLNGSLSMYDALTERGIVAFARESVKVMRAKPPLIAIVPAPLYLVLGRDPRAARLVNLVFLFLTLAAVYCITRRYGGDSAALLAVYVAGTMPMVYGLSRWFLTECAVTAMVCVCLWLLVDIDRDYRIRKVILLGVACGLGLLAKASFPLYVTIPLVFFAWTGRAAGKRMNLAAFALPVILLAAPWYAFNYSSALQTAMIAGTPETAHVYGWGNILSVGSAGEWLLNLANAGPVLYCLLLAILLLARVRSAGGPARKGLLLCGLWALPILFLGLSHYRDVRWAAPLFPALAVGIGILLGPLLQRRGVALAACVLLSVPLIGMLQSSFHLFGNGDFRMGGLLLRQERFSYGSAYNRTIWPHHDILADIARRHLLSPGGRTSLMVATDSPHFNADTFHLAAAASRLAFDVSTSAYDTDRGALLHGVREFDYVVYREGGEEISPFNRFGGDVVKEVRESGRFVELPIARVLPDGGIAHVFANLRLLESGAFLRGGMPALERAASVPSCSVTFGGRLRLTGFSLGRAPNGLRAQFRWQCLRPLDFNYRSFVHALDEHGGAVNLDHQILNDERPAVEWRTGDVAFESLLIPFADLPGQKSYKLRFGLYRRDTGDRLVIDASTLPLTDGQTAVLVGEAPQ